MLKFCIHYGIHFLLPLAIALTVYKKQWLNVYLIFLAAFIIDLDHLLATPIFNANRCSINFHPLHSYFAITAYILLLGFKKTRIVGVGLLCHIIADQVDCWML